MLVDDPLQVGRPGVAGSAPIGPKVHQYRLPVRGLDDVRVKTGVVDVEGVGIGVIDFTHGGFRRRVKWPTFYQRLRELENQ
jgi:hypothetical protein